MNIIAKKHQYNRPAIDESISFLREFNEGDVGSFIRFKDGFKRPYDQDYDNDDVYHIMYIDKDPETLENVAEFDFYIDKETHLIVFQTGTIDGMSYVLELEYYSENNQYPDETFYIDGF
ncbi:MAG TPA: hypothetical protein GXX70_05350 [Tepidimicrobium sp.]|nr:hypothetical protein [Tepidimicrobium sp.]